MKTTRFMAAGILALSMAASPGIVLAKDDTLANCRLVSDNGQRLACYDRLADKDRAETTERQEKQFGLNERQKAPEDRKEAEEVTAMVASAGGSQITLENGMVWRVVDNQRAAEWVQPGRKATVEKGLLSGYRMKVDGVNGTMVVMRVQ